MLLETTGFDEASHDRLDMPSASPRLTCLCIAACVALDFGIPAPDLMSAVRRGQRLSHARQIAMYLAHVVFGLPFDVVGRHFNRDRTTVAHACRVIEDARDDRWLDARLKALDQICRGAMIAAGTPR